MIEKLAAKIAAYLGKSGVICTEQTDVYAVVTALSSLSATATFLVKNKVTD